MILISGIMILRGWEQLEAIDRLFEETGFKNLSFDLRDIINPFIKATELMKKIEN